MPVRAIEPEYALRKTSDSRFFSLQFGPQPNQIPSETAAIVGRETLWGVALRQRSGVRAAAGALVSVDSRIWAESRLSQAHFGTSLRCGFEAEGEGSCEEETAH